MIHKTNFTDAELRYLRMLSKQYPTVHEASKEIIKLGAVLNLPKGTEHFMSDIHGEYEAFFHIFNSCSGEVKAKVEELFGNTLDQVEYAAEVAMEHHLGLTCDPICGLVQIPCIERNAVAANRAMNACNLSYFLTGSRNISYDMVCRAMKETGVNLNHRFRETSEGGLAKIYDRKRKK